MFCQPQEGRLPQEGTNEAATDTHVLELLGVEPVLGAETTLTFGIGGGRGGDHPDLYPLRLVGI